MKDEVKIYDKLDKKIIKIFTISTISTKTYYFKAWGPPRIKIGGYK